MNILTFDIEEWFHLLNNPITKSPKNWSDFESRTERNMDSIFENTFKALKPGGIFGIVEHRAKPGTSMEMMKKSGYVTEEHALEIAKKHGFELVATSEVNANPKDTANHPKGVWTLPPNYRLKDQDREKYTEIGESDRMTLLLKKPTQS